MNELLFPDIPGSIQQGYAFGNQVKQARRAEADQNMLMGLAPQIIAGDQGAYEQAAAIDPTKAAAYQSAGDNQLRRLKGAIAYLDGIQDPAKKDAAYRAEVVPYLSRFGQGKQPPATFAEAAPLMEQARTRIAAMEQARLAGGEIPTGWREFDMKARAAGLQPGTDEYKRAASVALGLEGRASSAGFSQVKFTDSQGRERIGVLNGKTGQIDLPDGTSFNPNTGAIAPTAPTASTSGDALPAGSTDQIMAAIADTANKLIAAGVPEDKVNTWAQQLPGMSAPSAAGGGADAFIGRRPEDQAAAVTAAQEATKQSFLPNELQMRTDAALRQAQGETAIRAQGEIAANQAKRSVSAQDTLGLLAQAEKLIPQSTGSVLGNVRDRTAAVVGESTPGAEAIASLKTISGQLVAKMPRMEGPQSDKDVQMYKDMAGDLANPNIPQSQRLAALSMIRVLNEKYAAPPEQLPPRLDYVNGGNSGAPNAGADPLGIL